MACDAALNTCEILEHIIGYLPHRQILTAGRVCKTWKELINSSTKIARARCLVPSPSLTSDRTRPDAGFYQAGAAIRFHPALDPHAPDFWHGRFGDGPLIPLLENRFELYKSCDQAPNTWPGGDEYLMSPPIQELEVMVAITGSGVQRGITRILHAAQGLRMKDLQMLEIEAFCGLDDRFDRWTVSADCCEWAETPPA